MTTFSILQFLSLYGTAIPFLVGLILYKNFDSTFKKVFWYIAYTVVSETVIKILAVNYYPTLFISSAYSVVELTFMLIIFYPFISSKKTQVFLIVLTLFYFVIYLWCRLFAEGIFLRLYTQIVAGSLCHILVSGLVILQLAKESEGRIVTNSHFLFAFAVLFFFSTNIFVYAVKGSFTIEENRLIYKYVWGIHSLVNFLFHVFITLAMWFNFRRIK